MKAQVRNGIVTGLKRDVTAMFKWVTANIESVTAINRVVADIFIAVTVLNKAVVTTAYAILKIDPG